MDTDRGLKNITIFQNFLVGACPLTYIASVQLEDHYFYMKTIIFYINFDQL